MRRKAALVAGVVLGAVGLPLLFAAAAIASVVVAAPEYAVSELMIIGSLLMVVSSFGAIGGDLAAWFLTTESRGRYLHGLAAAFPVMCAAAIVGGDVLAIHTQRTEFGEIETGR